MKTLKKPLKLLILMAFMANPRFVWITLLISLLGPCRRPEKQGFGHTPSHDHSGNRAVLWREFCQLVHDDRRNNEEAATLTRRGGVPEGAEDDDDDDDDDDEDAAPPCDPKFYRD
jgi:hypothetical protein